MNDTVAAYLAIGFIATIIVMFALGLKRGKNVQNTNEKIEENQRRSVEMAERQLALSERNVAAMERIADALERRDG